MILVMILVMVKMMAASLSTLWTVILIRTMLEMKRTTRKL